MTKFSSIIVIVLLFLCTKLEAQFSFSVSPPTCGTCCDGTIVVTQTLCAQGAALGSLTPTLVVNSYTNNTLVYVGACCGNYTLQMNSPYKDCVPGPYIGTVFVPCSTVGIEKIENQLFQARLFPNPATKACYMNISGFKCIVLTDMYGSILLSEQTEAMEIDLAAFKKGIYFVSISSAKGKILLRQKLVIE